MILSKRKFVNVKIDNLSVLIDRLREQQYVKNEICTMFTKTAFVF